MSQTADYGAVDVQVKAFIAAFEQGNPNLVADISSGIFGQNVRRQIKQLQQRGVRREVTILDAETVNMASAAPFLASDLSGSGPGVSTYLITGEVRLRYLDAGTGRELAEQHERNSTVIVQLVQAPLRLGGKRVHCLACGELMPLLDQGTCPACGGYYESGNYGWLLNQFDLRLMNAELNASAIGAVLQVGVLGMIGGTEAGIKAQRAVKQADPHFSKERTAALAQQLLLSVATLEAGSERSRFLSGMVHPEQIDRIEELASEWEPATVDVACRLSNVLDLTENEQGQFLRVELRNSWFTGGSGRGVDRDEVSDVVTLWRPAGTLTPPTPDGLRMIRCQACDGAVNLLESPQCPWCGEPLDAEPGRWLLWDIEQMSHGDITRLQAARRDKSVYSLGAVGKAVGQAAREVAAENIRNSTSTTGSLLQWVLSKFQR